MSLRLRITILAAAAVALAFIAASVMAWSIIRTSMFAQLDDSLLAKVPNAGRIESLTDQLPADATARDRLFRFNGLIQDNQVALQFLGPNGSVNRQVAPPGLELETAAVRDLPIPSRGEPRLDTVAIDGTDYRVLSTPVGGAGSLMRLFQPLTPLQETLTAVAWSLAGIALVGVALAAGLGGIVARTAVSPVHRLVDAAESVTKTGNLSRRVPVRLGARDEMARLSESFNAMLSALESSRAQQRELLENASHELRTPLTVLRNDFALLTRLEQREERADSERQQVIGDLESQVAALADEVDQIVTLARGDATGEPLRLVSLSDLLEQAATRVRRLNPLVTVRVDARPCSAAVYPGALERAVTNLARNAVQVSPAGGDVLITLSVTALGYRVEVCDNGPGLAPDEIPHLFQRFFRGAGSRERHGSGLGLAIVEQAALLHGGRAEATNRSGGGARFTLTWPSISRVPAASLESP